MRKLVRVLVARRADIQLIVVLDRVAVRAGDELQVVVVHVVVVAELEARHELVRCGDRLPRYQVLGLAPERVHLAAAVGALGLHLHVLRRAQRAGLGVQAEVRRPAIG